MSDYNPTGSTMSNFDFTEYTDLQIEELSTSSRRTLLMARKKGLDATERHYTSLIKALDQEFVHREEQYSLFAKLARQNSVEEVKAWFYAFDADPQRIRAAEVRYLHELREEGK